jgi:hypothetical protein
MSNMSYCRWQNTLSDLRDCAASLEERDSLSREERAAALATLQLCATMLEELGLSLDTDLTRHSIEQAFEAAYAEEEWS